MKRAPDFDRFFRPQSVAVVGASDSDGSQPAYYTRSLREWSDWVGARFYPVNPNRDRVDGGACFESISAVPESVDLAVILTSRAVEATREAAQAGASFAVVFAAGFSECGPEGARREAELAEALSGASTRLLGPNTNPNAFQILRADLEGPGIGLVTHSGAQGRPVFQGQELGIPISHWAPTGNELDLSASEFIRYFAESPDCGVVAAYLEGFRDGRDAVETARRALDCGLPVVVVKPGRTAVGRSWVGTHTAHVAGDDRVFSGFCRQFGWTRVEDLDELLETSALFLRWGEPDSESFETAALERGVCVYSMSGGTAAHVADLASERGLSLVELSAETQRRLREWIPEFLRIDNPVDSGGVGVFDDRHRKMIETLLAAPEVDVLIVPIPGSIGGVSGKFAREVVAAATQSGKRVCLVWGSPVGTEPAYTDVLLPSGLPIFRSYTNCLNAIAAYFDRAACRRTLAASQEVDSDVSGADPEWDSREYRDDSLQIAEAESLVRAHEILVSEGASDAALGTEFPGSGVSAVAELQELHVALRLDAVFGATVWLEHGRDRVDPLRDVVVRVAPFSGAEARRMLEDLQAPLASSERLREALAGFLVRLARLALRAGSQVDGLVLDGLSLDGLRGDSRGRESTVGAPGLGEEITVTELRWSRDREALERRKSLR